MEISIQAVQASSMWFRCQNRKRQPIAELWWRSSSWNASLQTRTTPQLPMPGLFFQWHQLWLVTLALIPMETLQPILYLQNKRERVYVCRFKRNFVWKEEYRNMQCKYICTWHFIKLKYWKTEMNIIKYFYQAIIFHIG